VQALDYSIHAIASQLSSRPRQRYASRRQHRPAGSDQSRPSSCSRRVSDGRRSPLARSVDGADQSSSRQLSRTVDSAPVRLRGREEPTSWPCNTTSCHASRSRF
jgi:hypothetical protein